MNISFSLCLYNRMHTSYIDKWKQIEVKFKKKHGEGERYEEQGWGVVVDIKYKMEQERSGVRAS